MKIDNPDEILEWGTAKLWNAVNMIKVEIGKEPRGYQKAKNGIKIEFPIHYIINEWYEAYPSTKRAKIIGYGKVKITELMDEIEDRNAIMREIVFEHTGDEDPTRPRV